jgi:DNA-binding Lrp family transcriptional regulator
MDEFDIKLLNALQAEGRLTNNELADRIGLSASQCSRRRAALEESGVIESYHAVLAAEAVGLDVLVFIQVGLATHSPDSAQAFVRLVDGIEEVQEAFSLTGDADYLVKMAVPDLKTLSRILNDVFLPHRSVARVHSYVVLDRVKQTTRLPLRYLSEAHGTQGGRPRTSATRKRLAKRPAKSPQLRVGTSATGNRRADAEKG